MFLHSGALVKRLGLLAFFKLSAIVSLWSANPGKPGVRPASPVPWQQGTGLAPFMDRARLV